MTTTFKMFAIALSAGVLLAACGTSTPDAPLASGKISSLEGKPGAPVSLAYTLPAAPKVGAEAIISMTFTIDSKVDDVVISVADSDGMKIVNVPAMRLGAQDAGAQHSFEMTVIPFAEGLQFLNVFAETRTGEHKRRRSFAIPVAGGGVKTLQKTNVEKTLMPDGENVIEMPAEESN